LLALVD